MARVVDKDLMHALRTGLGQPVCYAPATDATAARADLRYSLDTTAKMPPAVYRAVIDEAHKHGLRVAAHIFYMEGARDLVASGADRAGAAAWGGVIDRPGYR